MSQMSIHENSQFDFDHNDHNYHYDFDQGTDDVCIISFDDTFSNSYDQCIDNTYSISISQGTGNTFDNVKSTGIIKSIFANFVNDLTSKAIEQTDNAAIATK